MTAADSTSFTTEIDLNRRTDRVDSPQQYDNWRDYAFSETPEEEPQERP